MQWRPVDVSPLAVEVTVSGLGVSHHGWLRFGDGTSTRVDDDTPVVHTYPESGTYTAAITSDDGRRATTRVAVKDHHPRAWVYVNADNDHDVLLWIDEPDDGTTYLVDWGDGTDPEVIRGTSRVPPHPRVHHTYRTQGTYRVTATDTTTLRETTRTVDVGDIGVVFSFPMSPRMPKLEARYPARRARWDVDWGNNVSASGVVDAVGTITTMHPDDMEPGRYTVTLTEKPAPDYHPRRVVRRRIVIPTDWDFRLDVWLRWRQHDDDGDGEQTVDLSPRSAEHECIVDWGDGTATVTVQPGETVSHTYDLPVPSSGRHLRVREQHPEGERVYHRLLGEPRYVGPAVLSTRQPGAITMHVSGVDSLDNTDWFYIDWGDGTATDMGAVGYWWPSTHVYSREGDYTITVDGPGMPEPVERDVSVRNYPSPEINVREARVDMRGPRRTVEVLVDNTLPEHCGGNVRLRFGDDTGPLPVVRERDRMEYTYRNDGTYTVIAACMQDLTAKTRQDITVPFGPSHTLDVEWVRHSPADDYTVEAHVMDHDPEKTVQVRWGDGTSVQQVPPTGRLPHTYDSSGTYVVRASYTDGSESLTDAVDIPLDDDARYVGTWHGAKELTTA